MERDFYLRILNASPNSPDLDIYSDNKLLVSNLKYSEFSNYVKKNSGRYNFKVYKSTNKKNIILQDEVEFFSDNIYTVALMGNYDDEGFDFNLINDHLRQIDKNYSYIRFVNLTPSIRELDLVLNDKLVISNLSYGTYSNYLKLTPASYNLKAYSEENNKVVLENPKVVLNAGKIYSGYIVGTYENTNNRLKILLPLEGATYIKF